MVHPNSKHPHIEDKEGVLHVYVAAPAREGKANDAVIQALAMHYQVSKSMVSLVSGGKGKIKILDVTR
jgi:uncharacterized protein YggU (UPF0235/DUF167 family)